MKDLEPAHASLWAMLQTLTPARIGIRSVDGALPTAALLQLQEDHARARDAVFRDIDMGSLEHDIGSALPVIRVRSGARDRSSYIRMPSLGRRLDADSRERLAQQRADVPWDLTFVVADGLSGDAVMQNAVPTLFQCLALLEGMRISPVVLAAQGRVALGDEIASLLNSRLCVMLIGERPGLTISASLGAYITWAPHVGCNDASRNCVSNIHPEGLATAAAARLICWIAAEARRLNCSGTAIKGDAITTASALPKSGAAPRPEVGRAR